MKKYLNIISAIIGCIVLILFFIGIATSTEILKQIAFWIIVPWGILRPILHKRYDKKEDNNEWT